jgi:hypothetical protein
MRRSLMLLIAAAIVVTAPVANNARGTDLGSNSATHVTCRGTEWRGVGYAGCTQASRLTRWWREEALA